MKRDYNPQPFLLSYPPTPPTLPPPHDRTWTCCTFGSALGGSSLRPRKISVALKRCSPALRLRRHGPTKPPPAPLRSYAVTPPQRLECGPAHQSRSFATPNRNPSGQITIFPILRQSVTAEPCPAPLTRRVSCLCWTLSIVGFTGLQSSSLLTKRPGRVTDTNLLVVNRPSCF